VPRRSGSGIVGQADETDVFPSGSGSSQIKKHWSIPRKVYWLQINGKHKSKIQDWPKESLVVIKIRGLGAGGYGEEDDDDDCDAIDDDERGGYVRPEKKPKGVVRLSIGGRVVRVTNKATFMTVYDRFGVELEGDEVWLPSGERVQVDVKMRYYLAPNMEKIYYLDEVLYEDPAEMAENCLGPVSFTIEGRTFTVPNNQSFAEALLKQNIDIPTVYMTFPRRRTIDIRRGKIRFSLRATSEKVIQLRWNLEQQEERGDCEEEITNSEQGDEEETTA
jgi:hypothetical protein